MSPPGSVTHWIRELKAGNHAAAQQLWNHYFQRLVGLARKKLQDAPRQAADEEDVGLSSFASFCRGVAQGRFPQLHDRNDLWRVLVVITARKALDLIKREGRQKRGGGAPEALLRGALDEVDALEHVVGTEPTPEFAAQFAEEYQRRLDQLADDELRRVAVWKMEGNTTEEIAARLGCVPRTVERKLKVIRGIWLQETPP